MNDVTMIAWEQMKEEPAKLSEFQAGTLNLLYLELSKSFELFILHCQATIITLLDAIFAARSAWQST